jgi:hypothetical protein
MSRDCARRAVFLLCALSTFVLSSGLAAQQPKVPAPHKPILPRVRTRLRRNSRECPAPWLAASG